jgi:hypothetical protein
MNGTVTPSVVVVLAIASSGGGLAGSYDWRAPPVGLIALFVLRAVLTRPRLDLGTGEHGPADRVVRDRQAGAAARPCGFQDVATDAQALDHPFTGRVRMSREVARDILAVELELDVRSARHADEHVATGHEIGSIRQHLYPDAVRRGPRLCGRDRQHGGDHRHGQSQPKGTGDRADAHDETPPSPDPAALGGLLTGVFATECPESSRQAASATPKVRLRSCQ